MPRPAESSRTTISKESKACARALSKASAKKRSLYAGIRIETRGTDDATMARCLLLPRRRRRLHDLVEDLVLLDHAELEARALLDGVQSLLEVAHLGVERVVARLE